jgi:C4-dicarboxylate-specific signal transduction histidine kinase
VVRNACEAVSDGGHIKIVSRCVRNDDQVRAEVIVCDDGPGITDEVRRHMFDPFFSGREAGRGLGFGLSKCWRIVTDHGGGVLAHNRTGGVEIVIWLPIAEGV